MVSLAERPGTGYEISRQFDRSIGHFWSATHQQIYRTLKRLLADGLVGFETVAQDGRPDKKVYTLSEKGREALAEWAASPTTLPPLHSDLGVKIRAAAYSDLAAILGEIKAHRDQHLSQLKVFREWSADYYPDPAALRGSKLHRYLVLRGGIRMEEMFLEWCDEVIEALQRDLDDPAPADPTP